MGNKIRRIYIYKPTDLISGKTVIPIFFFKAKNETQAKFICPKFHQLQSSPELQLWLFLQISNSNPLA
ncbi:uncharacterized protein VP01_3084g3 [Puccinia sorghi]|uniref:Uncharacterized protein n=1 Tax=Puccinia sorghi TaxID=27349 RepID=A0A0L6UZM1_9BASI|nr:uncharacterized protein VP01_3084g3 [Puccinia sorghi]